MQQAAYPVQFRIDYPDRALDRMSTAFRTFVAIPILILLGTVAGGPGSGVPGREEGRRS